MPPIKSLANTYRKAVEITRELRDQIVSGHYAAGDRLPTRDALTASYGVSKVTVQRALEILEREGFIVSDGRRGTFVAELCPHLNRYALLFPRAIDRGTRNQFWTALALEARALDTNLEFQLFHGFEGRAGFLQYETLLADVQTNRLAGLIFASAPHSLLGTPLLEHPDVPRTAVMSESGLLPSLPVVSFADDAFLRLMFEEVHHLGRQRPAVLMASSHSMSYRESVLRHASHVGLTIPEAWMLGVHLDAAHWAEALILLLMDRPVAQRPDVLLLLDDNFVEPATRGLKRVGVRVPEDMHVIAGCNFPWPTPSHLPVSRIGYSVSECLRACVANIDRQRAGLPTPRVTRLPAYNERTFADAVHPPQWLEHRELDFAENATR